MMTKGSRFKNLPLILLVAAIALSPSFLAGTFGEGQKDIELRVEDFLIAILGLVWIANFLISGRKKIEKPPLFKPILVWLGIGFLSILTNWIFGNLGTSWGFFYFLKEVEFFFLYFYIFYHIRSVDSAKLIIKIWIFLGFVNVSWIIYQMVAGLRITYFYGPTAFFEPSGSFPSGGFFMILSIFLVNILFFHYLTINISKFKKGALGIIIASIAIGTLVSGSRASFWALIFAFAFTLFIGLLREKNFKLILASILTIAFLFSTFIYLASLWGTTEMTRPLRVAGMIGEYTEQESFTRIGLLKRHLTNLSEHPLAIFFGLGAIGEAHGQYIRILLERGIIGSLAFFSLIFIIIRTALRGFFSKRDSFTVGISGGLLAATVAMLLSSIPNDPFMVVKVAEVYWFFVAITMAVLVINNKQ